MTGFPVAARAEAAIMNMLKRVKGRCNLLIKLARLFQ
jgi:hypothetical protein